MTPPVGIIGSGSFGTAVANIIGQRREVLVYSRNAETVRRMNEDRQGKGARLHDRVRATNDRCELTEACDLILPMVPSGGFRKTIQDFAPHLRPYHLMVHGTKGFDITTPENGEKVTRRHIHTMSEVIRQESVVVRVGCLSGPNLAKEILAGQPTASVVASHFDEVIKAATQALDSKSFQVFGTYELLGVELAGALKNCIAIGSGMLAGKGLGKNLQALLINRGLIEMIYIGKAMGAGPKAFLGTAGVGDLVCTATSEKSRNFTFGKRLSGGESIEEIQASGTELVEGLRNLQIAHQLTEHYGITTPIFDMLHRVVYSRMTIETAIELLMRYPYYHDVDFL